MMQNLRLVSANLHTPDPYTAIFDTIISRHSDADIFTFVTDLAQPVFIVLDTGKVYAFDMYAHYYAYARRIFIDWGDAVTAKISLSRDGLSPLVFGQATFVQDTQYARVQD